MENNVAFNRTHGGGEGRKTDVEFKMRLSASIVTSPTLVK